MTTIQKNLTSQEILKNNIQATEQQSKSITKAAENISDPKLAAYFKAVGETLDKANNVDKVVLSKIEKPISKSDSIFSLIKTAFKTIF